MSRSTWRPMLRLAARAARRSPGRTVLIAILIAVPVMGAVAADLLVRTAGPPPAERARFHFGAADGVISVTDRNTVEPFRDWGPDQGFYLYLDSAGKPQRDPETVDLTELLPPETRLVDAPAVAETTIRFEDRKASYIELRQMDGTDPLIAPMLTVRSGRYPDRAGEVAITPALADRLDITEPGVSIRLAESNGFNGYDPRIDTDSEQTVVGIVRVRSRLSTQAVLTPAPPGGTVTLTSFDRDGEPVPNADGTPRARHYLVDWPGELSFEQVRALTETTAASGVTLIPSAAILNRDRWLGLGSAPTIIADPSSAAIGALIAGFGLLEIVLLAGAAFAVGIRRQTRELGLVAVVGGGAREIRRVVLAQGLVLGLIGGLAGVLAGLAIPMLARPLVEPLVGHEISVWGFAPIDYAVFAAVGVVSGLAAAVVPAVGAARMQPIAALAGRFRTSSGMARLPKLGLALIAAGVAGTLVGAAQLTAGLTAYEEAMADDIETVPPALGLPTAVGIGGLVLLALGLVRMMPAIVSWVGALARRLPPTSRMAARDGSRHRHRTAPAAAAIMITVAASTGLAFAFASAEARERAEYRPALPHGWASVWAEEGASMPGAPPNEALRDQLGRLMPNVRAHPIVSAFDADGVLGGKPVDPESDSWEPVVALGASHPDSPDETQTRELSIVGPELLRGIYGSDAAPAVEALEAGRIVVTPDPWTQEDPQDTAGWIEDGSVRLGGSWDAGEDPDGLTSTWPASEWIPSEVFYGLPQVMLTAETADEIGLKPTYQPGFTLEPIEPLTDAERDRAVAAFDDQEIYLDVEEGYVSSYWIGYLIVGGAAGLVTIVGIAIAVALSHAESRPDLATLAAVGAPPARRRALAAAQALLVGGLGCLVGVGLGVAFGQVLRSTVNASSLVVPWTHLTVTVVGVPLFAALCAALLTRSRLPMVRRLE